MQMMRHLIAPAVLAFLMASAVPSRAADLSVAGKIEPAGACGMVLDRGGVIDLGTFTRNTLPAVASPSALINVICSSPTKIAVRAVSDNRAGTANLDLYHNAIANPEIYYGLGTAGGKKIGAYRMELLDGGSYGDYGYLQILTLDEDGRWSPSPDGRHQLRHANGTLVSFKEYGGSTPDVPKAFKNYAIRIYLPIYLSGKNSLDLTQENVIDGSATLELLYL